MEDGRFILSGAVGHAQSVDTVSVDGPEGFIELGGREKPRWVPPITA
jgi:hypothetical protein